MLSTETSGDAALIAAVQRECGPGLRDRLVVVHVDDSRWAKKVRYATFGADLHTLFEIGSISKTFIGHLLADAVENDVVQLEQPIGSLLNVTGPVADVTLRQLATHQSGLATDPSTSSDFNAAWAAYNANNTNPNIFNLADLCRHAQESFNPANTGQLIYSNTGGALVGQALAAASNTDYRTLIHDRIFRHMNMVDSHCAFTQADIEPDPLIGLKANGNPAPPWWGGAYAPAGSIRTSVSDMGWWIIHLIEGTAPGMGAFSPHAVFGGWAKGLFWPLWAQPSLGSVEYAHAGQTGGSFAQIIVDRVHRRGVFLGGNTFVDYGNQGMINLLRNGGV